MKRITFLIAVMIVPALSFGQMKKFEYTPKVKGKIEIKDLLGNVSLQNTTGNAIVIESDFEVEKPDRANGLKLLGSAEDNTDLGVNINEENGVIYILGTVSKVRDHQYKISVPVGSAVSLDYNSPFAQGNLVIDSFKGSLETRTLNADVKVTNSTGPLTVNTISGNLEISFSSISQDAPTSLATISGLIDVTIPANEKATLGINSLNGNIYNNLDLKAAKETLDDQRAYGMKPIGQKGEFNLNGGGQKVLLKSISGNIYLRKR